MKLQLHRDKVFYKTMFSIAVPIAIQNLISSSLNMVDTVMISHLDKENLAAVGLSNQFFFLYALLMFGINSGGGIFIAQFWGKKDVINIRRVLGLSLISGAVLGFIFTILAIFTPELIMKVFTNDKTVINIGIRYLRIVGLSYIITAMSFSYSFACRGIGRAKLPMVISAISLGTNTVLNYILIFGHAGFKPMGVEGAAIATVIARIIELTLLLVIIYGKKEVLAGSFKEMFSISKEFIIKFYKTTIPVILNEGIWSLGITMYSVAYARLSTSAIASAQIASTIQSIFMVVSFGLGNASGVMIGNKLGANQKEDAVRYAGKFSVIGPAIGAVIGLMIFILSPLVLRLFNAEPDVYYSAQKILSVMSVFMAIKVFNIIQIVGILRSGGDTYYSLLADTGSVWFVGVPMAFLGVKLWGLPIHWVVFLVSLEELVKAAIGIPRIISKKWVRNVVDNM
jgi:putative MATE family efflux protein